MIGKPMEDIWVVYWLPDPKKQRVCDCKGDYTCGGTFGKWSKLPEINIDEPGKPHWYGWKK